MKLKFGKLKFGLGRFGRRDLARVFSQQWERLRVALAKLPSFKSLLLKVPSLRPWFYLVAGLLTADLMMQGLMATVFLDNSRGSAIPVRGQQAPVLRPRSTYNAITERNLFCPGCPVPDIKSLALTRPKDCNKAERMASGPRLLGTIVLSDPQYSVATISLGADSKAIKKNDMVSGAGKVFEIRRRRVCFENELGMLHYIEMPEDRSIQLGQPLPATMASNPGTEEITQNAAGEITIKRDYLMSKISDMNVLNSAASTAIYENGQLVGFKILSIKPGSAFEQLVQVGDEIRAINGDPITSFPQIQKTYAGIRTAKDLNLTIVRDGRTIQQTYKVE